MRNPLRSEANAFAWVLVIMAAAASIIALTLLTRPLVGAIWLAVLLAIAAVAAYRALARAFRSR